MTLRSAVCVKAITTSAVTKITMRKATPARLERVGFGDSGPDLGGGVSRGRSLGWALILLPPRLSGCLR